MADEELRRRARQALASPGDVQARARAASARLRAGEPPPAHLALQALEAAARSRRGASSRACGLAHVAWGWVRVGEPDRAAALAREAGGEPAPDRAAVDLWIDALARAGAALASGGRPDEGRALLARAGTALHGLAEPWSDLLRLHEDALQACAEGGVAARELPGLWPGLARTVEALVRGVLGGQLRPDPRLLGRLGLVEPASAALEAAAEAAPRDLAIQARAARAAVSLGGLSLERATALREALARDVARVADLEVWAIDETLVEAALVALPRVEPDPAAALRAWAGELEAHRAFGSAWYLRLAALELGAGPDELAGATAALLGLSTVTAAETRDGREPARHLARLVPLLARDAPGAGLLEALLERLPPAPLVQAELLQALAAHAGAATDPPALLGRVVAAAQGLLDAPRSPVWAALDALASAGKTALELDLPGVPGEVAARALQAIEAAWDQPALGYAGVRAAARLSAAAWSRVPDATAWRRAATAALAHLRGQDLEDAGLDAVRALARASDPAWRAEGLAEVAQALAGASDVALGDRHVLPPLRALAAALEPP